MDNKQISAILSAYRAGESFADDARFEEARRRAETDPALAQWWKEEQELDRLIGAKLEGVSVPTGLKARLLAAERPAVPYHRPIWPRRIALLAASIVLLAVFFGSWQGLFQPAVSLADYRDEMVSFVRRDPPLDLETDELSKVTEFFREKGTLGGLNVPPALRKLEAAGCRALRFRGHDVALICFTRENGELMHLLVVNRKAVRGVREAKTDPQFNPQGEWMTAAWQEGEHAYLLTTEGSRETLEKYISRS